MYKINDLFEYVTSGGEPKSRIITGYIGPSKVVDFLEKMQNTKFEICVGMYTKIPYAIYKALNKIQDDYGDRVKFFFSKKRVHIKTYMFLNHNNEITRVLNGSANLSTNAFSVQVESLSNVDLNVASKMALKAGFDYFFKNSFKLNDLECYNSNEIITSKDPDSSSDDIISWSILPKQNGKQKNILGLVGKADEMGMASGPNWGFSNGVNNIRDAYFKIPSNILREHSDFFSTRANNVIDMIFPDGTSLEMKMEGTQSINGLQGKFPKNLASSVSKKILGNYIRKKIYEITGKDVTIPESPLSNAKEKEHVIKNSKDYIDKIVTKDMFIEAFGGTTINIKNIGDEIYEVFFSKK